MQTKDQDIIDFHNSFIYNDIPDFDIVNKHESKVHKTFGKLIPSWMKLSTTLFPKVYVSFTREEIKLYPRAYLRMLQHEWVHLKDAYTFFNLLPRRLKWFNVILFYISYLFPQILAPLAVLGFANPWFFAFLLFALPLPAPFRMLSEIRAYRRSLELGSNVDGMIENFTTSKYYFMWPFKKHVKKMLESKPSPYLKQMYVVWKMTIGEPR